LVKGPPALVSVEILNVSPDSSEPMIRAVIRVLPAATTLTDSGAVISQSSMHEDAIPRPD